LNTREGDEEGSSNAYLGLDVYDAPVSLEDIQCRGQAEAHAVSFGSKIRFKKAGQGFVGNAAAIVCDLYAEVIAEVQ
jgi:hypothetical protein